MLKAELPYFADKSVGTLTPCSACVMLGQQRKKYTLLPKLHANGGAQLLCAGLAGDTLVLEFMQRGQLAAGDPNAFPVLFISSVMQVIALMLVSHTLSCFQILKLIHIAVLDAYAMHEVPQLEHTQCVEFLSVGCALASWQTRWKSVCLQCMQLQLRLSMSQGVGELLGQPQQRRRLRAAQQPGRVNGTQFDLSSINAGLGGNAAAACTPSVACNASWALPAAAVVDIYAINARGGVPVSMGLCTGARLAP